MGLGRFGGGAAAARWLVRQGAVVTVTDLAKEDDLADSLDLLRGEQIAQFRLGEHREEDFRDADLVVVNPAVRPGNPLLKIARESGAQLSSEIELFMKTCPAPIVGVTGSNGKSTTAAMIAAILQAAAARTPRRQTWLGGNIGNSLLGQLDRIAHDDWVVLELSSFQLWHLGPDAPMPHVAVVTNCSLNHLDWHGDYSHYVGAKQRILTGQTADDLAVLNTQDAEVGNWTRLVRGRRLPLVPLDEIPPLPVAGEHNRTNAACAAVAAKAVGCDEAIIRRGLESFRALPQRLEQVAVIEGRRFYDDSAATTPESTITTLKSLDGPIWLLAGGGDKGCRFEGLAAAIAENARGVAFFGKIRQRLLGGLGEVTSSVHCTATESLADALGWCWERSRPGDAIVLSPACPCDGQFANYRKRGRQFVALAGTCSLFRAARPRHVEKGDRHRAGNVFPQA